MTTGNKDTIDWNCHGCGTLYLTNEGLPSMSNFMVDENGVPSAKHHCDECGVEVVSPVGYYTDRER